MSDFLEDDFFAALAEDAPQITTRRENGRKRPRGYIDWCPQAHVRALLDDVDEILFEYEEQLPVTIRQIFYRLVGRFGYPKDELAYKRLCEHLGSARRARRIPFDAIRDDGIVTIRNAKYGGIEDFHDETGRRARAYRRDRQAGQPQYVELWCEAGGMLHQLDRIADRYSVPVYSAGGFASLTGNYAIAERALEREVPTVLLHVGDFDPSGESIFTAMSEDARAFVRADRVIQNLDILPVRVALTADQIAEHDLPTAPAKKSDKRSKTWRGETCQLEALPPDVLAGIVDRAIVDELDLDRYEQVLEHEAGDRAELLALPPGAAT
jgi:hypothetical protein